MGNRLAAKAFTAAAEAFWRVRDPAVVPTRDEVLQALDAVGKVYRGRDVNSGDDQYVPGSPLYRMIIIGFDATAEEMADPTGDAFYHGPIERFRGRYKFC